MVNYSKIVAIGLGILVPNYLLMALGLQGISGFVSERILNQEHLDGVVKEEAKKLGLNNLVMGVFREKKSSAYKTLLGARSSILYDTDNNGNAVAIKFLELKEGYGANRSVVRHELYHLKKHLPRKRESFLKEMFYEEPTATIYECFGIVL
ncbi:hypothetical protein COU61_02545 [Candidatus Pacearchaeota archaeon CG10_big_fil_rev_8_21_14_0_10_35_13]|nr:MAG: hypothetical protein COU61_02545 [Candidatus Pacearchaeota archaeon CG10_big_fil_rev_8_21_14_0_10_35_13]